MDQRIARAGAAVVLALALAATVAAQPLASSATTTTQPLASDPPEAAVEPMTVEPLRAIPPPAVRLPPLAIESLERAWRQPSAGLAARAAQVRELADAIGIRNVDPLARAALWESDAATSDLDRARAAVLLAPELPLAQAALAQAAWDAGSYGEAMQSAGRAIAALPVHLDGWLWLGATGWLLGAAALALGSLAFLCARGFAAARFVAHDLGDTLEPTMPAFARVALLVALLAIPIAFGEGLAGLALGLVALGFVARARAARVAVALAALGFVAAIHPIAREAGVRLGAFGSDAAALASWAAESGFVDTADALRLTRAATPQDGVADPLALAANAEWKRRSGDLAAADAAYAQLIADPDADVATLSNTAVVKLAIGDPHAAIELYRRAIALESSALLWFNLSQAHGAAIDVEQHDRALAAAQSIDRGVVSELTERLAAARSPQAAALPLPQSRVRERLLGRDVTAAAPFRDRLAPGWIGRSLPGALVAFALAAVLGFGLGARVEPSTGCSDCGAHLCPRCGAAPRGDGRCEHCQRRRFEGRGAWDPSGARRSLASRLHGFARFCLPGLYGGGAAPVGLAVAIAASGAVAFAFWHGSLLPDSGSVGGAGVLAFGVAAALCVALHATLAVVAGRIATRGRS